MGLEVMTTYDKVAFEGEVHLIYGRAVLCFEYIMLHLICMYVGQDVVARACVFVRE
jgi:hypothetical protein